MVHFPNATIKVAEMTTERNDEGTLIEEYDFETPIGTFRADVQPNTLTKEQMELYGIDEKTAHTKKVFFTSSGVMTTGNRVEVDYNDGTVEYYNICPVNKWRMHCEALLIPVENE